MTFNGDGTVNAFDFGLLAANFNGDFTPIAETAAALGITTIPEPGTAAVLMGLGVLGIATRRREVSSKHN